MSSGLRRWGIVACLAALAVLVPVRADDALRVARFSLLHAGDGIGPRVLRPCEDAVVEVHVPGLLVPQGFLTALTGALAELEAAFGDLPSPVLFRVGAGAMQIAWDRETGAVSMPGGAAVRNYGLDDRDLLRHETFHAVVGRMFPALVTPERLGDEASVALHEATADFFASLGDDDDTFGDRYYADGRPLRKYRTPMRYTLVTGAHAKGNTLTSHLIARGATLQEVADFFRSRPFELASLIRAGEGPAFGLGGGGAPEVRIAVPGQATSAIGRYRVRAGDLVSLTCSEACARTFPGMSFDFAGKDGKAPLVFGFEGAEGPGTCFRIVALQPRGAEKVVVRHVADGRVVGFSILYLSLAAP